MKYHRMERMQEVVHHALNSILLFESSDFRLKEVTVTRVFITKDLGIVRVYYESRVPREERGGLQKALERASRFIRKQLATQVNFKLVPELEFYYDETTEKVAQVEKLMGQL